VQARPALSRVDLQIDGTKSIARSHRGQSLFAFLKRCSLKSWVSCSSNVSRLGVLHFLKTESPRALAFARRGPEQLRSPAADGDTSCPRCSRITCRHLADEVPSPPETGPAAQGPVGLLGADCVEKVLSCDAGRWV